MTDDQGPRSHSIARQTELFEKACRLIPGGTQLISRRPSKFAPGMSPIYATDAWGPRFRDLDGNEYIDWVSGIGAIILGYADPIVDAAVCEQIGHGTIYSVNHALEVELAEELVASIPCAEMVRYAKGGGDACAIAVRIARGTTGRDRILFSGYHGWHDWYLAANLTEGSLDSHLFPQIDPTGVPHCLEGSAVPFPYGDAGELARLLEEHRGEVAAIIMEPLRSEWPPAGYLEEVRRLTSEQGIVLIFDEVSTGLRLSTGGVQPAVGVVPDMAVFAKSLSNGYAFGAVVGTRAVMEPAAAMFISSTYWSDTIGLRAALTTVREVRKRGVPAVLADFGSRLKSRLNEVADQTRCPVRCVGIDVHPRLEFDTHDDAQRRLVHTVYIQEMARRGCHGYTSFYLNAAQGDVELDQTARAAEEVFSLIRRGIEQDNLANLLVGPLQEDTFRRLVR